MSIFTILSVASSITSAFMGVQQAAAMQAYYQAQADMTRLQYRAKRIEAKEQGVEALKNSNRAAAAIAAKGAAGGILINSGSVQNLLGITAREGALDLRTAQLNEQILDDMGQIQYNNLIQAGKNKGATGILGALSGLGTDITNIYTGGLFDKPPISTSGTTGSGE